jgi:hypothetical protein
MYTNHSHQFGHPSVRRCPLEAWFEPKVLSVGITYISLYISIHMFNSIQCLRSVH